MNRASRLSSPVTLQVHAHAHAHGITLRCPPSLRPPILRGGQETASSNISHTRTPTAFKLLHIISNIRGANLHAAPPRTSDLAARLEIAATLPCCCALISIHSSFRSSRATDNIETNSACVEVQRRFCTGSVNQVEL